MFFTPPALFPSRLAIVAVGTGATGTGTGVSVSPPAASWVGDLLLCFISTQDGAITAPAGYTQIANSPQNAGIAGASAQLAIYQKTHSGSEGAVTVGLASSPVVAVIIALRKASTTLITAGDSGSASTSVTCPSVTTTAANSLVIAAVAHTADASVGSWANANLTEFGEIFDLSTAESNDGGMAIAAGYKVTAGAAGTTTATIAVSSAQGRITIGVTPS